jgi:F-type H+-transporting ATPase subunit a
MRLLGGILLSLSLAAAPVAAAPAQDHGPKAPAPTQPAAQQPVEQPHDADSAASAIGAREARGEQHEGTAHGEPAGPVDIITPHITDSYHMEIPWPTWPAMAKEVCIGHHDPATGHCGPLWPTLGYIPLGPLGRLDVNLSPTKHVVMLLLAALLTCAVLITAAQAHKRHHHAVGRPRGFAAGIEGMVLFLRNEVVLPNVGHHGQGFAPFILTLFFFILFANLLGLIPYGSTATGNISVTATLAIITFVVIEISGMRALGAGYLNTIVYWPHDMPLVMKLPMTIIMTPIEIIGKFTKPFALAIRLFANMTAGHIVVLALLGLIFTFRSYAIGVAPLLMAVAIMMLELFVAFLQAFIFSLLASVFIGQIREAHH